MGFVEGSAGFGGDGDGLMKDMICDKQRVVLQTEDKTVGGLFKDLPTIERSSDPCLKSLRLFEVV